MSAGTPLSMRVDDVHKRYRLGTLNSRMLSEEMGALWARVRGKADPRMAVGSDEQRQGEWFWSLRGVGFDLPQGQVLGIIGRNGAGKSTLLKLLSRISHPTKGTIRIRGRVASLLEVGTGFHPELTGRENIFLNGAILGMKRADIQRQLDEIVAFSGIVDHIDTPIKRYSSGMKVRLGFAVAAHLEPDILVLDEVLAVGDAEFQKKCLGKMREVSNTEGRTVLFVSHNMAAVKSLCDRAIVLDKGVKVFDGDTAAAVNFYLKGDADLANARRFGDTIDNADLKLHEIALRPSGSDPDAPLDEHHAIELHTRITIKRNASKRRVVFVLNNEDGVTLFTMSHARSNITLNEGENHLVCEMPAGFLNVGSYYLSLYLIEDGRITVHRELDVATFNVQEGERGLGAWMGREPGFIKPRFQWRSLPT